MKNLEDIYIILKNTIDKIGGIIIMSDSLTYIDKCLVASMAAVNASYLSREGSSRSASNAAIETMKIKKGQMTYYLINIYIQ